MRRLQAVVVLLVAALVSFPSGLANADTDRTVRSVRFNEGSTSTVIKGSVEGYHYVDYQLRAGAGQRMVVSLHSSHGANYFNLLPPDSNGVAMYAGEVGGNQFAGLLPDDGVYTLRVYLMRSAARRKESAHYTLAIQVDGARLQPLASKDDAVVRGTRYHAHATVACRPAYTQTRTCEAWVVRRGNDGTATVELRWDAASKRRILFVKGEAKAADAAQAPNFSKGEKGNFVVSFGGEERFEIPKALVFGG